MLLNGIDGTKQSTASCAGFANEALLAVLYSPRPAARLPGYKSHGDGDGVGTSVGAVVDGKQ